jgi:hypothetical protein
LSLSSLVVTTLALVAACGGDTSDETGETSGDGDGDVVGDGDGDGDESGEGGAQPGGDGDTASSAFCLSDKDCTDAGAVCDLSRYGCVECSSEADCATESICRASQCLAVTECNSTKDCAVDEVCVSVLGYCAECGADADCASDSVCIDYACHRACASDKDCSALDAVCDMETLSCVECVGVADCDAGKMCGPSRECVPQICGEAQTVCEGLTLYTFLESLDGFSPAACPLGCDNEGIACAEPEDCVQGDLG